MNISVLQPSKRSVKGYAILGLSMGIAFAGLQSAQAKTQSIPAVVGTAVGAGIGSVVGAATGGNFGAGALGALGGLAGEKLGPVVAAHPAATVKTVLVVESGPTGWMNYGIGKGISAIKKLF